MVPPFTFPTPKQYTARLEEKIAHNDKYIEFDFELVEPHSMPFLAGQYVSIQVSERGDRRSYSICSRPDIDHGFELLVDVEPQGLGSQYLQNLEIGQEIKFLGPLGRFVIDEPEADNPIVFVATGSGVAPFRSMIMDLLQVQQSQRDLTLYFGLRFPQHLFWQDELLEIAEAFPNFHFHPVMSKAPEEWHLCHGRVTDCLAVHEQPANASYYLCGNKPMIEQVTQQLVAMGVEPGKIHHEKFF